MTRRDFLKQIGKFFIGLAAVYAGKLLGLFKLPSSSGKIAKYYRQADDLAG